MQLSSMFKRLASTFLVFIMSLQYGLAEEKAAKYLFGAKKLPTVMPAASHGFYTKGCLSGGVAIPIDGPTWQAMRLERNRRWGHPTLITMVKDLSQKTAAHDGWPGLLVGDISQPRGGPMLSGHASHQVGLDADIWLTPMPSRTLTHTERTNMSAISVLKKGALKVDQNIWTPAHAKLIMRAAGYNEVERLFVHPAIKRELCDNWQGDRTHLGKVRPYYGHHYHFHIRMKCLSGSPNCKRQAAVPKGDGCGAPLDWWFEPARWAPAKPKKPGVKPKPRKLKSMADLPNSCAVVLNGPTPKSEADVTLGKMVFSQVQLNYTGRPDFKSIKDVPLPSDS